MNIRTSLLKAFLIVGVLSAHPAIAQDSKELYNTATKFMRSGDYSNAILVFNQALQLEPENFEFRKQLGFTYYLKGDLIKAKSVIEPLLSNKEADIQVFQIAGNIYIGREEYKVAQRMYERGLRKFPNSGELYNDNGSLLMNIKLYDGALKSWIKGIEQDPTFPGNYYNATKTYNYSNNPLWCILYGEIFMNMESFTTRTAEIRTIVLESYKKLFNDPSLFESAVAEAKKSKRGNSEFVEAYRNCMSKQISVITGGIDPDALIMARTRFLLDWYNQAAEQFPFALFDFQRELLRAGMYEAYNQWLFGPAANQANYKAWTTLHKQEYDAFQQYQRRNPLKPRADEYYNDGKFTLINSGY
ncbi:tetratricopeptide repeat protein [Chitinophaga silvatica]|uniref:Tetratricopeptide repeat protein n=1 Tax=Chitinophaga silvatica TaxID=2282649 RepID=A0A3E1YC80_9BACT|nr:tetratricopeptide repeat protein [Chitinophaga silvatica]RFS23892.1 tetratricopeptide repeat protein [Chitinophaga silvatica]